MGDWDIQFCRSQRTGKGRVGISVNKRDIWCFFKQDIFDKSKHLTGHIAMSPGTDSEIVIGHIYF